MPLTQQLCEYLNETTGYTPKVTELEEKLVKRLPFFIRDTYNFQVFSTMNQSYIIAAKRGRMELKPSQIATHAELLKKELNLDVAFAFQLLPAYVRQRLVQKGVAFIVPGIHLFLPFLMMDFRTRTRKDVHEPVDNPGPLSMPSQVILLYHLQRGSLASRTLGELSRQFNYSAMTLSRVRIELSQRGLCRTQREGVRKRLRFTKSGRDLYKMALPYLQNPVMDRKTAHINEKKMARLPHAGTTALSDYTDLADEESPTVALTSFDWRRSLESGDIIELPHQDESGIHVEVWGYEPELLMENKSPAVDRLSLYLTFKESHDERVQKAMDSLLEEVSWSKE